MPGRSIENFKSEINGFQTQLMYIIVHITEATRQALNEQFKLEPGNGHERSKYLAEHGMQTTL